MTNNNHLDFKKLLKIFLITAGLTFLFFICLAIYFTVTDSDDETDTKPATSESSATSQSVEAVAGLTEGDSTYQEVFNKYEKSYVYYINMFGTQLSNYESGETTKEELATTSTEFKQILNQFLTTSSETTAEQFNESKELAVSSASDTISALEGLETIIQTENTSNYENTTENMQKGINKFNQSQEKFMDTVKSLTNE